MEAKEIIINCFAGEKSNRLSKCPREDVEEQ